tara:strand:- start:2014 stop:2490 length:477 start_codon:yes stop_codon:yes gene_type:complete
MWKQPPASEPAINDGKKYILGGLKLRPELNGQSVTLLQWVGEKRRWRCKLDDGNVLGVKSENLCEPDAESNHPKKSTAAHDGNLAVSALRQLLKEQEGDTPPHFCLKCATPCHTGEKCCGWYAGVPPLAPGMEIRGMNLKFSSWPHMNDPSAPYVRKE